MQQVGNFLINQSLCNQRQHLNLPIRQDFRLQRAKELLSTTSMSIKEIAYRLNFESPDYFSAIFKIKTGRRPSELRNQ
jgi:AraC-like DNA-binding protein